MLPAFLTAPNPQQYLTSSNYLVLDFETTNLDKGAPINRENSLLLACWKFQGSRYACFGGEYEQDLLLQHIEQADFIVCQNVKFELGWLMRCGLDLRTVLCYDTMLAEWVLLGNQSRGLQDLGLNVSCARRGIAGKEDRVASLISNGVDPQNIPRGWLRYYCHQDVSITEELFLVQRQLLAEKGMLHIQYSRCLLTPVLVDMEFNGVTLDKGRVYEEYNKTMEEFVATQAKLDALAKSSGYENINWRSGAQVGEFLYDVLGFDELSHRGKPVRTAKDKRKTDADTISALKATNKRQREFVELYHRGAYLNARLTKALTFFKAVCDEHDCTFYGIFNQGTTKTHRLSSTGRPIFIDDLEAKKPGKKKRVGAQLQNLAREFKRLFRAKRKGWEICEIDSGQLEFRVAAILTEDAVAADEIINEADVHSITAAYLTDAGEPTSRQDAKSRCVPMDTQILTRRGWKLYDELIVGEDVCTYNAETGVLEWGPCLEKVKHEAVDTYSLGFGHNWRTVSTDNHRWYGWKRTDHGKFSSYDRAVLETKDIHTNHRIAVSAPLKAKTTNSCSPADAAVVAWIMTDGTYKISPLTYTTSQGADGRRQGFQASIIQKKAKGIAHIETTLRASGMNYVVSPHGKDGCVQFRMAAVELRALFLRCGLTLENPEEQLPVWVLTLSEEARAAFLEACVIAEGTNHGRDVYRVAQNLGPIKEAIHLAAYLQGHDVRVTITPKEKVKLANYDHATLRLRNKGYINTTKIVRRFESTQDVWCPRTGNGTWVMRQGETVTITGNTFRPLFAGSSGTPAEQAYCKFFQQKYGTMYKAQTGWCFEVLKNKELVTPYGMRYYWPSCKMQQSGYITGTTEIFNAPVQGLATAEIVPIAVVHAWHRLKGWPVKLILTIHDSLVMEKSIDLDKEKLYEQLTLAFTSDVYNFLNLCYNYSIGSVPLAAGLKCGEFWGEGEETTATTYPDEPNEIAWSVKDKSQEGGKRKWITTVKDEPCS